MNAWIKQNWKIITAAAFGVLIVGVFIGNDIQNKESKKYGFASVNEYIRAKDQGARTPEELRQASARFKVARAKDAEKALFKAEDITNSYANVHFIVCSDDIAWCKTHLSFMGDVSFSEGHDAVQDLAILSKCNHTILTHGSFSWWAAWLAGGDVIYYDRNYADKKRLASELENFFLHEWIAMH